MLRSYSKESAFVLSIVLMFAVSASALAMEYTLNSQTYFNEGTYASTYYNTSEEAVMLNSTTLGNYTSKIFDASGIAGWNNISWVTEVCYGCELPNYGANDSGDYLYPINMDQIEVLYHFNETSGNVYDYSGYNRHTVVHGTNLNVPGILGSGSYFDNNDWIAMNMSYNDARIYNLTVCGWFKVGVNEGEWSIVDFDRSEYYNLEVDRQRANVVNFATTGSNNQIHDMYGVKNVMDNQWHLACGTFNVSHKIIYVDGAMDRTVTNPHAGNPIGSTSAIRYGFVGDGSEATTFDGSRNSIYWEGYIDEIAIWNRTLDATEISNLYKRGALRLNLTVRSCDDSMCSGDSYVDINDTSTETLSVAYSNYFQYNLELSSLSSSFTPKIYNITLSYSPLIKVHWVKSYVNGSLRYATAKNKTIRIKSRVQYTPQISLRDPDNDLVIVAQNMTNETTPQSNVATWYYDFIPNETGWYSVTISGKEFDNIFFSADVFQDNQTDANGNVYPFRMSVNVTEPGTIERLFEPVDINLNLTYKSANDSIIIAAQDYEGDFIQLPLQRYNKSLDSGSINNLNTMFLSHLESDESRIYYIYYSRSITNSSSFDNDLNVTIISDGYYIANSRYTISLNETVGGVLYSLFNKQGTNGDLAGFSPSQLSPSVRVGPYIYRASDVSSPTTSLSNGTLMTKYNTSGTAGSIDFFLEYTFYANLPYIKLITSVTPRSTETWDYYRDHNYYLTDGLFSSANWRNSSAQNLYEIGSGNGADQSSLGNLSWICAMNNGTGDSIGALFLSEVTTQSPELDASFNDDSGYEYFTHQLYSGTVTSADSFNSSSAIVLFNSIDNTNELNDTYTRLLNPVSVNYINTITFDSVTPFFNESNYTPQILYDNETVTCYSFWLDNLELDYAIITVNSSGYYNQTQTNLSVNESWVNITVSTQSLGAGNATCNITVVDIAGLRNDTFHSFIIADSAAPEFSEINHTPNTNDTLDPGDVVIVNANITEYTNISNVYIEYRNASNATWYNKSMNLTGTSYPNSTYVANFTASVEGTWEYRITADDTYGNSDTSDIYYAYVYWDLTWLAGPSYMSAYSGFLTENISIGNISLNNTGDQNLTFRVDSNWPIDAEIFYNGSAEGTSGRNYTLTPGVNISIPVIVTASSSERTDSLTITVTAFNSSASPSSSQHNATIISYASGPVLYVTFDEYPISVTQGDTNVAVIAKIQNKGNESATNPWLAYSLPTGWSVTSGDLNVTGSILDVDDEMFNLVIVSIGGSAPTGAQNISASAYCDENKSGADSVTTIVIAQQTTTPPAPSGGSGGGGGSRVPLPIMENDTNETTITTEDLIERILSGEELLRSQESFELVRGFTESFTIQVNNIFEGTTLENVVLTVDGYLSQYLQITPEMIEKIEYDETYDFTIQVTSPEYMEKGTHKLRIVIKGDILGDRIDKDLIDTRDVELIIHTVSKEQAEAAISMANTDIDRMKATGFKTQKTLKLLDEGRALLMQKDYEGARDKALAVSSISSTAFAASELLKQVNLLLQEARQKERASLTPVTGGAIAGVTDTFSETTNLINLAIGAMEREDFDAALQRAKDAKVAVAVEAGNITPISFILKYWWIIPLVILFVSTAGFFSFRAYSKLSISQKLSDLDAEEHSLLQTLRDAQRKYYQQKGGDKSSFLSTMDLCKEKMARLRQKRINLRHRKIQMLKPQQVQKDLEEERQDVDRLVRELQTKFFVKQEISKSWYEEQEKVYQARLAEIDEEQWSLK